MKECPAIERINVSGISIAKELYEFVENEILQGLGLESDDIWAGYADLLNELVPQNKWLIKHRDELQAQIDSWHKQFQGDKFNFEKYTSFLRDIGYIEPEGQPFEIETQDIDDEIAKIAGPQLVVPVNNARFAINAANARWGSLYDAFYGTDVIDRTDELAPGKGFNKQRGLKVIQRAQAFLDETFPLTGMLHSQVVTYKLADTAGRQRLLVVSNDGQTQYLQDEAQFVGDSNRGDSKVFSVKKQRLTC